MMHKLSLPASSATFLVSLTAAAARIFTVPTDIIVGLLTEQASFDIVTKLRVCVSTDSVAAQLFAC
jgi:hypothetical protein